MSRPLEPEAVIIPRPSQLRPEDSAPAWDTGPPPTTSSRPDHAAGPKRLGSSAARILRRVLVVLAIVSAIIGCAAITTLFMSWLLTQ
jgi:hypothetical protein